MGGSQVNMTLLDRVPPNNLEAEQSTIGSVLIDREAYFAVKDIGLTTGDFYREAHQIIFAAAASLYEQERQVDIVTLQEELRTSGKLELTGGMEYLTSLIDSVPTAKNAAYYAQIVKEKAVRRQWIDATYRLNAAAHNEDMSIEQLSIMANDAELAIAQRTCAGDWTSYAEIIPRVAETIGAAYESGDSLTGISTGLPGLDGIIGGWQAKELAMIAARPSKGKTALALQFGEAAARQGYPAAIFSLEMDEDELGFRAIGADTGMDSYALRKPRFGEEGWQTVFRAVGRLSELPVYINDEPMIRHTDIFPLARRACMEHGVKLFIFDYAQLAEGPKGESRSREVGAIVHAMRITAKRLDVAFIGLSQLSRQCEVEKRRPRLSDLRDSGEIEQEVQVCIFIHFEGDTDVAELIVAKNRKGRKGSVPVLWQPGIMRFVCRTDRAE